MEIYDNIDILDNTNTTKITESLNMYELAKQLEKKKKNHFQRR